LFATIGIKNPRKWVKKRESQVGELDKLKLKTAVLHDDQDGEIHKTRLVVFVASESAFG